MGFARLHLSKVPMDAVDLLHDRVLPIYEVQGGPCSVCSDAPLKGLLRQTERGALTELPSPQQGTDDECTSENCPDPASDYLTPQPHAWPTQE